MTDSPKQIDDTSHYVLTRDEFEWFASCIEQLPQDIKDGVLLISPVARGEGFWRIYRSG